MQMIWLDATTVDQYLERLCALLGEAVESGASIGFMLPINYAEVTAYWHDVADSVRHQKKHLLVVVDAKSQVIGTAQLEPSPKENGRHRAEVQKVIVANAVRRQGIGTLMMEQLDLKAKQLQRSMLFLDTRVGDAGEHLYVKSGWQKFGVAPDYAYSPNGELEGSAFYFKRLYDV